jgi:DNA (cytosine-5)-methyltransferase 1
MGASLIKYYGQGTGQSVDDPLHTATSKDRSGVNAVFLSKYFAGGYTGAGATVEDPLPTVTAWDHNAMCAAHIAEFKGEDKGQEPRRPLRTITASAGQFGAVKTHLCKAGEEFNLRRWPEVRELLNTHCGYEIADDEILLLEIAGTMWFISDIGLRMLTPKELYAAQGFPEDYIIDRDHTGKAYNKSQQVARCGNAVPPPFAYALAAANLPEYARAGIDTMNKLEEVIAA